MWFNFHNLILTFPSCKNYNENNRQEGVNQRLKTKFNLVAKVGSPFAIMDGIIEKNNENSRLN